MTWTLIGTRSGARRPERDADRPGEQADAGDRATRAAGASSTCGRPCARPVTERACRDACLDVMKHILGSHCLRVHSSLNEGQVRPHCLIQVMGREQHVELFVVGVNRERVGPVGRARQDVRLAGAAHDVRSIAPPELSQWYTWMTRPPIAAMESS
jgi:hypothetical protein